MLFNSIEYAIFLSIIFILHWFVFKKTIQLQNSLLLVSSYVFYGLWDWRFLFLIFLSTSVDYLIGLKIFKCQGRSLKRLYLSLSITFNLGVLILYKYFNFFIDSLFGIVNLISPIENDFLIINLIVPIGISFYTFQTLSYSIDIYLNKLKPTRDFISFATFVSFFPQLLAGPIERGSNFLPQILKKRNFRFLQGIEGSKLILWGLFKKIVIADSLSPFVDNIFANYLNLDGGILLLGLIYCSIQVYCDFSGYSDIAIGTAKLFGIELMSNFKYPFFSRNITGFWRKWHMSMSGFFRDYLFMPLIIKFRYHGKFGLIFSTFLTFSIIGLWHGANFTYVFFGVYHAILLLPNIIKKKKPYKYLAFESGSLKTNIIDFFLILKTYLLTTISWAFFRSETLFDSFNYLYNMITKISILKSELNGLFFVIIIIFLDWNHRKDERNILSFNSKIKRNIYYVFLFVMILLFSANSGEPFIYFQF